MTVALVNSMTSLYAAVVVFSMLGFKAAQDYGRCLDRCARRPQGPQGPTHDLVSSGAGVRSVPQQHSPRQPGETCPGTGPLQPVRVQGVPDPGGCPHRDGRAQGCGGAGSVGP